MSIRLHLVFAIVAAVPITSTGLAKERVQAATELATAPLSAALPTTAAKSATTVIPATDRTFSHIKQQHPELSSAELTITGERISFLSGHFPMTGNEAVLAASSKTLHPAIHSELSTQQFISAASGLGFINRYKSLFGVANASGELLFTASEVDELGVTHVNFQQMYQGVVVFQSRIDMHVGPDGAIKAAVSQFIPGIDIGDVTPSLTRADVIQKMQRSSPNAKLAGEPELVVYPTDEDLAKPVTRLAWLVESRDDSIPSRTIHVIDAHSGRTVDLIDLMTHARDRRTYFANFQMNLPGTLVRNEGQPPVSPALPDINKVHDYVGATYDYFLSRHNRDSWDGNGATCVSTTYVRQQADQPYRNAAWNGEQMFFGEGMTGRDVTAHEFTHAVVQKTAGLVYRFQPGALNESFADIFGSALDPDDWTIGEDTVLGTLRDMQNPSNPALIVMFDGALRDRRQPDHTSQYDHSCQSCGQVHKHSGIPNRAFYLIASTLGRNKAEQMYYRALRYYLQERSRFKDARAAVILAATDLFGCAGNEVVTVRNAFNTVGITPGWDLPRIACSAACACGVTAVTDDASIFPMRLQGQAIAETLYKTRDSILATGYGKYYADLFYVHTGRIALLLTDDPSLRSQFGQLLSAFEPGLNALAEGRGHSVHLSHRLATQALTFLNALATADRMHGDEMLAVAIEAEIARLALAEMSGLSFAQAWARFGGVPVRDSRNRMTP